MSLRAKILRCGCEPRLNLPGVDEGPWTCCDACGDSPCWYALLSRCTHWAPDGEKLLESCLLFKKDCIRGCNGWSSRWDNSGQPDQPVFRPTKCVTTSCTGVIRTSDCDLCEDVDCFDLALTQARCTDLLETGCFPRFGYETCPELFNALPYTVRLTRVYQNYWRGDSQHTSCDGQDTFDWTWELILCQTDPQLFGASNEIRVTERKNGQLYATWVIPLLGIGGCVDGYSGEIPGTAYSQGSSFSVTASVDVTLTPVECDAGEEPPPEGEPIPRITVEASATSCYWSVDDEELFRKWIFYKDDLDGYLKLNTRTGAEALYRCRNMVCTGPSTFYQISRTEPDLDGLPRRLCLLPLESEPTKVCLTAEDQCNCNDPGAMTATYNLEIRGCDGVLFNGTTSASRDYSGVSWPCGIDFPNPAPCGAFLFDLPLGDCGDAAKFVIWCDGSDYRGLAYCYDEDAMCWELQGAIGITREDRCLGPYLVLTLPEMDCCCTGVACSDCEIPATLTVEFTSTCSVFDGEIVTVTQINATTWTGALRFVYGVRVRCVDGAFTVYADSTGCEAEMPATVIGCDPFEAETETVTFTENINCTDCVEGSDTISAVVTE